MIKKILIANRGEIALRVIKTCRRLGIKTVGIYAQDDSSLPHSYEADECVALGRGSLSETYLNQEKIISIAKDLGVDAIHPGYGFLSENRDFCKAVTAAGIKFIGPTPEAIELMGDKTSSKVKMQELGVPLIPGYHGDNQEDSFLFDQAKSIGFPVLIKATAGGGGKGMRIVHAEDEFESALAGAKREAKNAFGNDKVLIERYVQNPRHIEVQLVSDGQDNHFHFYERECSIQRRYQKVIEEAPAVGLNEKLKKDMCSAAVTIAKGIKYAGAGTIEFILENNENFYFLEMNTRLQVEHPITEMTTGVDLVELQIKAANGEAFDFKQEDIVQRGHAVECRIYAEDPDNDFLPTNGKIQQIAGTARVDYRLDCGYVSSNSISTSYDPMLAKLITYDEDRMGALDKMYLALNDVVFGGVKTNRDYLKRVLQNEKFLAGEITTHFLVENKSSLEKQELSSFEKALTASAILVHKSSNIQNVWDYKTTAFTKEVDIDGEKVEFVIEEFNKSRVKVRLKDQTYLFETNNIQENQIGFLNDGFMYEVCIYALNAQKHLQIILSDNEVVGIEGLKAQGKASGASAHAGSLQSPMPGKIFKILLDIGKEVSKGDPVIIVEAMKMEHTIRAPQDGVVKEIFFKEGDQVQGGVALCHIE